MLRPKRLSFAKKNKKNETEGRASGPAGHDTKTTHG